MHERLRNALLGQWGRLAAGRPKTTLVLCLLLAAVSVALTTTRLEFRADRSDLVDPELSWNKRYADYKDQFQRWDDLIVCLEGPAVDSRVDDLARDLAARLVAEHRIAAADAGFDVSQTGPRLFRAAPGDIFDDVLGQLEQARRIAAAQNANAALGLLLDRVRDDPVPDARLESLDLFLDPFLAALDGDTPDFAFLLPDQPRWLPMVSQTGSGRIRFMRVKFVDTDAGIDTISTNLRWLRHVIETTVTQSGLRDTVTWGVTGIPAIEADETTQSIHDSTLASIVAFILITALMIAVFRGVVVPLLAGAALVIGLSWSFGWLILSVGHLQLLSVVFTVILMGLGIDFALHLVARLELVQDEHDTLPSAIARVYRGIGPGMLTGAVTTAAAFAATALTQFDGMKEMGIIAGGGVILCLVAMLSSFPAALALTGRWKSIIRHRPGGEHAHFAHGRLDAVDRRPRRTLLLAGIAVLLLVLASLSVRYDPNVLNLQPPGIESVEWERRIVEDDARSVWAALVKTTPGNAPGLADRLRALPEVSDVGGMGLLLPIDRNERTVRAHTLRDLVIESATAAPDLMTTCRQLTTIRLGLAARLNSAAETDAQRIAGLLARIDAAIAEITVASPEERTSRTYVLNASFDQTRQHLQEWLDAALADAPLGPEDLPPQLRAQWAPAEDTWLLKVYPVADPNGRSILHPDRLGRFVHAVRVIAPDVLGPPVQIYESSELIKTEYSKAAVYAVAAILVLLLIDFRSLADALCAMLPVTIGFIGVFGMLGLTGIPLNFANIIVMPLIFGIGVDAGVHMVHRWRQQPYGRPAGLSGATGRGITLTMLTTMIGFGSMLLAQHRGIRSLGFVMVVGLGVTLVACYLVLPAVLRLRAAAPTEEVRRT